MVTTDANGKELSNGDAVHLTQGLKVKGSSINLKKGEKVKNIRLTDNQQEVECRIGKSVVVLKTCFLKKA